MTGGSIDIKADEKGVKGEIFIPIIEPKRKVSAEIVGSINAPYRGKRPTWGAGIKIRF